MQLSLFVRRAAMQPTPKTTFSTWGAAAALVLSLTGGPTSACLCSPEKWQAYPQKWYNRLQTQSHIQSNSFALMDICNDQGPITDTKCI